MATLEKIRSRSGLLIASIAIALLCFVVGDALNNSSALFNNSRNVVGTVDDETMSIEDFQNQVSVMTNVFKMSGQQMDDGDVRDAAWNTFIQSVVLNEEAAKAGLTVTPSELKEATLGENVHPMMRQIPLFYNEERQFDKTILLKVLAAIDNDDSQAKTLKDTWLFWEKRIKEAILNDKMLKMVSVAMSEPKAETEFLASLYGKEMTVAFSSKPYSSLADSLFTPSEEQLKAKYESQKESFKTDGYRNAKVIAFDVYPTEEDYQATLEKVVSAANYLKQVKDEELSFFVSQESDADVPFNPFYRTKNDIDPDFQTFAFSAVKDSVADVALRGNAYKTAKVLSKIVSRPDSMNVSAIAIAGNSIEAASKTADSLLAVLNSGTDFVEIAAKHSADPNGRKNGGEWGWLREGVTGSAEFDSTVFSAKKNEVVKVITPQAVLVVKVNDATAPVEKVRLAVISNKVLASGATSRSVFEKANGFIAKNNTKDKFEAAAKEANYVVRNLGPFFENQSNLYVVTNGRPIIKWAYESNLNDVCKKPFETKDQYIVGYVDEIVEKGYVPFKNERTQGQLKRDVINDLKAEKIMGELKSATDLSSVGTVDTVTVSFDSNGVAKIGQEPAFVATAMNAQNNNMKVVKGNAAVYALQVIDSKDSGLGTAKAESSAENQNQMAAGMMINTLMKIAEVQDNRSRFY